MALLESMKPRITYGYGSLDEEPKVAKDGDRAVKFTLEVLKK
jgi:hypothetical protein